MRNLTFLGLVLVGGLMGCGSLQFSASTGTADSSDGASGDGEANVDGGKTSALGARVKKVYASWSHSNCDSSCNYQFARAAGVMPDGQRGGALQNPKSEMSNPDPEWLPGWDALPSDESSAHEVWAALEAAATKKSWLAMCHKGYEVYKKDLDERLKRVRADIAKARTTTDPLERVRGIFTLPERTNEQRQYRSEFVPGLDAVAYEVEEALYDELRKQRKAWVIAAERKAVHPSVREVLAPRWEAALEERAYCMVAQQRGLGEVTPFPTAPSRRLDGVRDLFTEAERKEIDAKEKERLATAEKALSTNEPSLQKMPEIFGTRKEAKITSFTVANGKTTLKLHEKSEFGSSIGTTCVDSAGRHGPCPVMNVKKDEYTTIVFDEWPAGVKLQDGDVVQFFGFTIARDVLGQGTPVQKWTHEIRGVHVTLVTKKDGTKVAYW